MPGPAVSEVGIEPLIALRTIRSTVTPTNCLIASSRQWAVATLSSLSISPHPLPRGVVVAQEHTLPSNIHAREPYSHRTRPPAALIRSRSAPTGQIRRRHSPSVTRMGYRGGKSMYRAWTQLCWCCWSAFWFYWTQVWTQLRPRAASSESEPRTAGIA